MLPTKINLHPMWPPMYRKTPCFRSTFVFQAQNLGSVKDGGLSEKKTKMVSLNIAFNTFLQQGDEARNRHVCRFHLQGCKLLTLGKLPHVAGENLATKAAKIVRLFSKFSAELPNFAIHVHGALLGSSSL